MFELHSQPTNDMLDDWGGKLGNTVLKLAGIIEKIKRTDVLELLQEQLQLLQCNCGNCPDFSEGMQMIADEDETSSSSSGP